MNILIVGDVGELSHSWRHIGDEAMLYTNIKKIQAKDPHAKITLLSNTLSHSQLNLYKEILNSDFNTSKTRLLKLAGFAVLVFALKHLKLNFFRLPTIIKNQDYILFSGGGNLNSLFPGILYNRTKISLIARIYNKPLIITGQTIGPIFSQQDRVLLTILLKFSKIIGIRDKSYSSEYIRPTRYLLKTKSAPDDAYLFPLQPEKNIQLSIDRSFFNIGISLRDWDSDLLKKTLKEVFTVPFHLNSPKPIRLYLIPHIIDEHDKGDLEAMREIFKNSILNTIDLDHRLISSNQNISPEEIVFRFTAAMDMVITTRYHGLIFSLDACVPTLGIFENEYYKMKLLGAFETICPKLKETCTFEFNEITPPQLIREKIESVYANRVKISKYLQEARAAICTNEFNLYSVNDIKKQ